MGEQGKRQQHSSKLESGEGSFTKLLSSTKGLRSASMLSLQISANTGRRYHKETETIP